MILWAAKRLLASAVVLLLLPATAEAVHFPNQGGCTSPGTTRKLQYEPEGKFWVARVDVDRNPIKKSGTVRVRWVDPRTGHRVGPPLRYTLVNAGDFKGRLTD